MRVITGKARGITLKTPEGMRTRPTAERVKEALFSAVQFEIPESRVLDLFGGTGQLGIEALSRGAQSCTFVDCQESACRLIRENLRRTRLENMASVQRMDYMTFLNQCREKYSLILLDPPYAEVFLENALKRISEIDILADGGIIITERPAEKRLCGDFGDLYPARDYRYGKTCITLFRNRRAMEDR